MQQYQRQANILKRTDQIIALLDEICIEHPYRFDPSKIKKPIQLINLAWVIAICRKGLASFRDVDFKDTALNSMAETMRQNLIGALNAPTKLKLKLRYIDEVDLAYGVTVTKTMTYELPPELVIKLISNNSIYKQQVDPGKDSALGGSLPTIDTTIDTVLDANFTTLIRNTFPEYTGKIQNKTSAPHKLVIKVMIMMVKIGHQDITWSSVKGFIEEYIHGIYAREQLANIEKFNDDVLIVDGKDLTKNNATRKVGEYKNIFKIKTNQEKFK